MLPFGYKWGYIWGKLVYDKYKYFVANLAISVFNGSLSKNQLLVWTEPFWLPPILAAWPLTHYMELSEMNLQVLFCSTEVGRTSFVRQLEPDWHIDSNPEIVTQLAVRYNSFHSISICLCCSIIHKVRIRLVSLDIFSNGTLYQPPL